MNIFSKIARRVFSGTANIGRRMFYAAQVNRLNADFSTTTTSIITDIRTGGKQLRTRARDLSINNDIAKRYIHLVRTNVVGHTGFTLQVKSKLLNGKMDERTNTILENAFNDWCKMKHCTVAGNMTFRGVQDMTVVGTARDGEILIRMVTVPNSKYGMKLQIIPPEYLEENYNAELDGGRFIRMGIEYDENGAPIAYHIRKETTASAVWGFYQTNKYERVPANEIVHAFMPEFANQGRGFSWYAQSMLRLHMLKGYEDATLVNARASASKGVIYYAENAPPAEFVGDEQDAQGNQLQAIEPGMVEMAPPGYKPMQLAPEYPSAQHEMFVRSMLRAIASGLNVSYNLLANDLVGVNYSSIRAGLLDEREMWRLYQAWFTETVLEPIFDRWLAMAIMRGAVPFTMDQYERINIPQFYGRTWAWVDPLKDVEAKILEVAAGFTTNNDVLAEKGKDLVETYTQLAVEKKMAEDLGLSLKGFEETTPAAAEPNDTGDGEGKKDPKGNEADEEDRAAQIARLKNVRASVDRILATIKN